MEIPELSKNRVVEMEFLIGNHIKEHTMSLTVGVV